MSGGHDPEARVDERALAAEFEHLLERERDAEALELAVAAAAHHASWSALAELAGELRQLHFGEAGASRGAGDLQVVRDALRLSARLRPHARGRLCVWERVLLRGALP